MHVPPALALLEVLRERLSGVPHVLCPDTAFHSGLPEVAATYPLPAEWRKRYGLRRYGFHGLSYRWALDRTAELLRRPAAELSVLMTHLGGGCSVCAVRDGRSADTSMGFTPLEGVPMSKRSGSVDPGMLLWLLRQNHLDLDAVEHGLNQESGLLGLSGGLSGDTRDLVAAAGEGNATAALALQVFAHRVRRELAAAPPRSTGSTRWCSPARSAGTSPRCAPTSWRACRCSACPATSSTTPMTTGGSAAPACRYSWCARARSCSCAGTPWP